MVAISATGTIAHVCLKKIFNLPEPHDFAGPHFNAILCRLAAQAIQKFLSRDP